MLAVPFRQDVELLEEGLVVAALGRLVGTLVDLGDLLGQFQRHSQLLGVENHPALGFGQRFFGGVYLGFQPYPLVTEGIGRDVVALLSVQADEAYLLGLELGSQRGLGVSHLGYRFLADAYQRFNGFRPSLHIFGAQLDRTLDVVAGDGLLNQFWANVGPHRALGAVDTAHAEEVGVLAAVAAGGDGKGQALAAFAAEDRAAQVVVAMLGALASRPLFVQTRLHQVEGVLVNERLMTAGEDFLVRGAALVDNPSGVIGIAQDALKRRRAGFAARMPPRPAGAQAEPVQLARELGDGVFAAGIQLEGGGHEVVALRVGDNAGDLPAVWKFLGVVEVADTRPAVGAAVLGLLEQAALDALAGQH